MKPVDLAPEDISRFWEKVDASGDCWLWTASLQNSGYGQMRITVGGKRSMGLAHRVSFQIHHGRTPTAVIDHRCHNRACVNPNHLREVTTKQNLEHRQGANSNSASGVRGVRWDQLCRKWRAEVMHHGKRHHVGLYDSLDDAAAAAATKRNELFTHNDFDRGLS